MFVRQLSHKMKKPISKWVLGHKVTPHDTTGNYDLALGETPPGVPGPPPHLHHNLEESFLITEGEMEFMIDGEIRVVKAGESVNLPPNTLHTFKNSGSSTCKWVNVHSPKGFRAFFEKLGVDSTTENAQQNSVTPQIIEEVLKTAASYDMQIKM